MKKSLIILTSFILLACDKKINVSNIKETSCSIANSATAIVNIDASHNGIVYIDGEKYPWEFLDIVELNEGSHEFKLMIDNKVNVVNGELYSGKCYKVILLDK